MTPLRVVIVDDELAGRQRVEGLITRHEDVEVAGSFGDPREAVEALRRDPPDLVFLDVQMPELDGLEVVRRVGPDRMPPTIFVTAYDQYALGAFEIAALDYLLKPFDDERFERALARARERIRLEEVERLSDRMRILLDTQETPASGAAHSPAEYLERVAVEVKGRVVVVPTVHIDYISAEGPYVKLHLANDSYLVRERMITLEERLDPEQFCRIHRSTIVNLDRIAYLEPMFRGDYMVRLADGTRLRLSRSRREELAQQLGIEI